MHVAVVTPPELFVTVEQAKAHLGVESAAFDTTIRTYVAAAIGHLDGPEGYLRRAIGRQVLAATVYAWPVSREAGLQLPYPPIVAVEKVEYLNAAGQAVEVEPDVYETTPEGRFRLAYGAAWPSRRSALDPVKITYRAGWASVPAQIITAVLMHVGAMFDRRDETAEFPDGAKRLISPLRIPRV